MNDEKGRVVGIENSEVIVEFYRSSACEKCGACMMAKDTGKMVIKLPHSENVEVGDEVKVDVKKEFYLFSTVMLYLVPLAVLIATIFIALKVFGTETGQVLAAFLGMVLSFGSYFAMRIFKKRFMDMKTKSMTYYKV